MEHNNVLAGSPLFKSLTINEIESVLSKVPHKVRKFNSGSLIAQSGEQVNSLMIVISGLIKAEMVDYTGRIIKIEDIPAPGAIAPAFMFGNKNRFPVNVIAVPDTEVLIIEKSDFLKLLRNNDIILVNFLDMISNRSRFLSDKIKFLNFKTIRSKLAMYILELAGETKVEIKLDRTQNDLADYFGVARPSVARALGELEEMGIIQTHGKYIKLLRKELLADLITEL
jgi:CRP/FNR family transcriptional regulator, dissimilatory nitrate respiration regulator